MKENLSNSIDSAVYVTADICALFQCNINDIDPLIKNGTIPPPLPHKPKGKRRWTKNSVHKKLGIKTESQSLSLSREEIKSLVTTTVLQILSNNSMEAQS